ncbi:uncharacterized protein LOC119068147 [Bradysia coprophila]|uniref:uncharacterized protein LOC119068147 n=1 Tax=Bradysia coprophila TaxID=38358 RepID=UPI00187DA85B|nr:uncharacterized protein LOC119068147 [Bradysia coprophila]
MHQPLFKSDIKARELSYKPTAIIMGNTGAGKTTLANKLCQTNHDAGAGEGSVTQKLFRNDVCFGMNAFSLIDTPGTDSMANTYKHAFQLREALTATAVNTIFIVIRYENRFEKMVETFYAQPVHLFANKIVVMISHLDVSENAEKDYDGIVKVFAKHCPDVLNIIFYSRKSPCADIADCMFVCISNMKAEKIQISDEYFQLNFNTFEATFQMSRSFQVYQHEARALETRLKDYINSDMDSSLDETDDRDELLHMLLVQFKNDLDTMYDDFVKEHREKMTDMNYFTFPIKLQAQNVQLIDDFTNFVVPRMSYNLFDKQDPRNLIKRCPHCQLIWYKTEGCDGETTCGNRGFSNSAPAASLTKLFKYVISYVHGKVKIRKNQIQKTSPIRAAPCTSSAKGCNAKIVWKDLPKLDDVLIFSLYSVKTMDEAKEIVKAERFKLDRKRYEGRIDTQFYT